MVSKEDAKKEVSRLIEKYNRVVQSGSKYNEEMTKKDFILPLFRALGWDVEDSNEVTAEESLLKGAVDYAFLINKNYKFFVEAKPLGSDLKRFAQQAVEYGVNSGNTWVVLTSFESLVIFNCEWKEKNWWKNSLFSLEVKDYLDSSGFDKLWLLSKESTINNALDDYAKSISKGVPRTPIDKELLSKFLQYRTKLSKEISKISKYNETEIDELVQRLLIRLLFIRNCEDRGFETKYKLLSIVEGFKTHKRGLSKFLRAVFDYYNSRYNGSIFKEAEIDKIRFDEKLLAEIIEGLYYTVDRLKYNFNIIPADVMGSLYEQYLGHILKKTPQSAKLKEGKVHRKEQGIYYTPTYIVDYIVRNTLGELLKGKKVDASKIRVLDPACGSGSFLVKAFDVLNEHYAKDKESYGQKTLAGNDITYSAKERILKNNIFGVDLDKQAAEIARLNLLLRIAAQEQKLPLLEQNIQIGNSLIDDEKVAGDKAFKWEEKFAEIMKDGGFDVVVGNPPYIKIQNIPEKEREYFVNYKHASGKFDVYLLFIEKSISLTKQGGRVSFITPSNYLKAQYGKEIRAKLSKSTSINVFVDFGDLKVFSEVTTYPSIIIFQNSMPKKGHKFRYIKVKSLSQSSVLKLYEALIKDFNDDDIESFFVSQSTLSEQSWSMQNQISSDIIEKMKSKANVTLGKICERIFTGVQTSADKEYVINSNDSRMQSIDKGILKPYLFGKDVRRWAIKFRNNYVIYPHKKVNGVVVAVSEKEMKTNYLNTWKYLNQEKIKSKLLSRDYLIKEIKSGNREEWYEVWCQRDPDWFDAQKILTPALSDRPNFTFDSKGYYFVSGSAGVYGIILKPEYATQEFYKYILGILNSRLIDFFIKSISPMFSGGYYKYNTQYLEPLPIIIPQKDMINRMNMLVDNILLLTKRFNELGDKLTDGRTKIEEGIKKIDSEIDELVYKIYGITEEEKKVIEESLK